MLRTLRRLAFAAAVAWAIAASVLTGAMALSQAAFDLVSSFAERVTDGSLRKKQANALETERANTRTARRDLDAANRRAADLGHRLEAERGRTASSRRDLDAANRRVAAMDNRLAGAVADSDALRKGAEEQQRRARNLVAGATRDASRRVAGQVLRSAASAPARSLPYFGTALTAVDVGFALDDACETMKVLRELSRAFDVQAADPSEVCGMPRPSAGDLWEDVVASPQRVWTGAIVLYDGLPDVDASAIASDWYTSILSWF